ncbi:MAG: hypothetical protein ACI3XZ_09390 [Butyricicoccus sp.]
MEHTYLFKSGCWRAEGFYHIGEGKTAPLTGEVTLTRTGETWTLRSFLDAAFDEPLHVENNYAIRATVNPMELAWTAQDPALGELEGAFVVLPGIITSSYTAPDGVHSGSEMLMQVSENEYKIQSVLNEHGDPVRWWEGRLIFDDAR